MAGLWQQARADGLLFGFEKINKKKSDLKKKFFGEAQGPDQRPPAVGQGLEDEKISKI